MKNKEKVKYWLDCAEYDFQTAQVMLDGRRYLYVGFMCHQTIEKSLKAYYSSRYDDSPPYTHKLIRLSRDAGLYEDFSEEQKDTIDTLEPLNIEARYPSHKEELLRSLTPAKSLEIIEKTGELYQWISMKLLKL